MDELEVARTSLLNGPQSIVFVVLLVAVVMYLCRCPQGKEDE